MIDSAARQLLQQRQQQRLFIDQLKSLTVAPPDDSPQNEQIQELLSDQLTVSALILETLQGLEETFNQLLVYTDKMSTDLKELATATSQIGEMRTVINRVVAGSTEEV